MEYYYLNHDYNGDRKASGAIFTPAEPAGVDDIHLLLFGHHSKYKDVMFGGLHDLYAAADDGKAHHRAWLIYPDHTECYELWCAVSSMHDDPVYEVPYQSGTDSYSKLIATISNKSLYENSERPKNTDRTLVLSTCNGRAGGKERFYAVFKNIGKGASK